MKVKQVSKMVETRVFLIMRIPGCKELFRCLRSSAVILLLMGCEAPLMLDEVEQSRQNFTRRTDTFLAIGSNAEDIVVVGSHGLVLVSNDDGLSWQRQELPGWPGLIDVTACANGNIAALSFEGDIWVSEDRGSSWQARKLGSDESPQAITCDNANRLWVVGAFTTILNTDDLGNNWSVFTTDEDIILNNIQFISDTEAFVSGEFGTLMRTTDSGQSWETLPPMRQDFYPQDMYFEDSQTGWVIGLVGLVLHTSDGGQSWQQQQSNTLVSLFRLAKSRQHLFAVGGEGKIFFLNGEVWEVVNHGQNIRLYLGGIEALQNNRIVVSGPAGTLHILSVDKMMGTNVGASAQVSDPNINKKG
jgi:photosystem II stability/assembly factor-like uncharacterized protein